MDRRVERLRSALSTERAIVASLVRAIDAKYQTAPEHATTLVELAAGLGRAVGLAAEELDALRAAALLHDIGTLVLPVAVVTKPGPLSAEEFAQVRLHPCVGADLLADLPGAAPIATIVRAHHERWDGLGYPDGTCGESIPVGARVLAIVDAFDSMTRARRDRDALPDAVAAAALEREAGKAFDPWLVERFLQWLSEGGTGPTGTLSHAGEYGARACGLIARAHRESTALHELSNALGSSLDLSDTVAAIAETFRPFVPHDACALLLPAADGALQCRVARGLDAHRLSAACWHAASEVTRRLSIERQAICAADDGAIWADVLPAGGRMASALVVPLEAATTLVGALAFFSRTPGAFSADHQRVFAQASANLAARVQNVLRFQQAREEALTDPLTGLPNIRFLSMHLTQEIARAARQRSQLALLVVDIDDFKRVNDSEGHVAGDRTLVEVARSLAASVRPYDVCARYAGDEFVVMMPECGPAEAEQRRLELAEVIRRVQVLAGPDRVITVTATVGAAVFPDDGDCYEDLLRAADRRMYSGKARTKGLVLPLPPLPERRVDVPLETVLGQWLQDGRASSSHSE